MEELGIPDLTTEQIETLCQNAENAARKHILSSLSSKMVEKLNISVKAEGEKSLNITVEIDLALSPRMKNFKVDMLAKEAVEKAFKESENYLRKLKCHSQT